MSPCLLNVNHAFVSISGEGYCVTESKNTTTTAENLSNAGTPYNQAPTVDPEIFGIPRNSRKFGGGVALLILRSCALIGHFDHFLQGFPVRCCFLVFPVCKKDIKFFIGGKKKKCTQKKNHLKKKAITGICWSNKDITKKQK